MRSSRLICAAWRPQQQDVAARAIRSLISSPCRIGTALFTNGHLVPNTELGHLVLRGRAAERRAANSVRAAKSLSWKKWSRRLDEYLHLLQRYLWPDLIIIGGGVSAKWRKFLPRLTLPTPIVPAKLRNDAGIIGAALAYEHERRRSRQKRSLG